MLGLGLSADERTALLATLVTSHRIRLQVDVLGRNEGVRSSLTVPQSKVLDGAVEVDAQADISRSLRLTIVDRKHALGFDAASPSAGALFADNMLAVRYGVYVATLGRWVDIPVFWGPLTKFERAGSQVQLEAQGKEALALDPHFATQGYTLRKGMRVDNAIRAVMDRLGERRYSLVDMPARLPRARVVEPEDEPWDVVKFGWEAEVMRKRGKGKKRRRERVTVEYNGLISLAGPFILFYDGRGRLVGRRRSTNVLFTFEEGVHLIREPDVVFDALAACNRVTVTGATVTVGKKPHRRQVQRRASAQLQPTNPLSPAALARHGKPRYMSDFVVADNLKTKAACLKRAKHVLRERSQDGVDVSFESLPVPLLEEGDFVRVKTSEYSLKFRLQRFTIPLTSAETMSVGWTR